ncbi:MAG: glycosyltransferase family 4 protein, partial [Anaerolineales bacterium]|nr:glycosyltransferase family 4 protein [Anaerolineales bacterium]
MHILLFNFFYKPNPDYQNMASGLRRRGHTVWLGFRSAEGDLQWHDGETFVGRQRGPGSVTGTVSRIPGLSHLLNRLLFLAFLFRIRGFIKQTSPQIVQLNPGSLNFPWVLKMFMPANIHFIFDIRHLNVGIRDDVVGRFREWLLVQDYWLHARFIYNHACFNHEHTAQLLLGKTWHKWATVVPVGLDEQFFTIVPENETAVSPVHPLQFIYVGAITRFRALETIFEAAQLARQQTDRFRVVLIGPDKTDGYYHRLVAQMGLEDLVYIKPPIPYHTVAPTMAAYDVGLAYIPDRRTWHYQPTIKVLEYRALGLPILSIDVPSHRELVEQEVNGLLVENTVESLAEGMIRYVIDRAFWSHCRENALTMRKGLSICDVARMYDEAVYQKLVRYQPETDKT